MITQLEADVLSIYDGSVISSIIFTNADSAEYVIKNIDGLGPVKSVVSTYTTSFDPGDGLLTEQDGTRNIVLTVGYKPNFTANSTVGALRQALARVLRPSQLVTLKFTDDVLGVRMINGVVESNEPVLFASDPTVQISILCVDPYFHGTAGLTTINETLPLTMAGAPNAAYAIIPTITCTSEVPVGFTMKATFNAAITSPIFFLTQNIGNAPVGRLFGQSNFNILSGDVWEWSSVKNSRHMTLLRSAALSSELYYLYGSLVTTQLMPGPNKFLMYDLGQVPRLSALSFSYEPLYLGM